MHRRLLVILAAALAMVATVPVAAAKPTPEPITVLGPYVLGEPQGDAFVAELAAFTTENRVEVIYEQYFDNAELVDRVTGADPPDLIISPHPGELVALAPELVDLAEFVNPRQLRRDFSGYLIDLATVDGAVLGAPIGLYPKSLVWYKPASFEAAGYEIPQTFDELVALCDRMVADGRVPWSNYIESGFATGWVGTDWVEDLLLGAEGPTVYDQWVDHTIPFTDARVEAAFERYVQMIDTPGYVFDRSNMRDTPFYLSVEPLVAGDALMHKQATFFNDFLEIVGADPGEYATFRFPSVDAAFNDSVTGGGDYLAAVSDRKEVKQLTRFMLSQRFGREALAANGGWLLPNARFDDKRYTSDLTRSWAEVTQDAVRAGQFRFDGSDIMPPPVGAGSFWAGIVDLVVVPPARTIPQVLSDIDASWPS